MSFLPRTLLRRLPSTLPSRPSPHTRQFLLPTVAATLPSRSYASKRNAKRSSRDDDEDTVPVVSKGKGGKSKKNAPVGMDAAAEDEMEAAALEKAEVKMDKAVDYFRGVVYDGVQRGKGVISPSYLDSVKVKPPESESLEPLANYASVTVKNTTLYVEVYDSETMKAVESALHKANLPGVTPIKFDSRTIKITLVRPTQDVRTAILKDLAASVEKAKVQVRGARTDALKFVKEKSGVIGKKIQDATDKRNKALDELLEQAKREMAKA